MGDVTDSRTMLTLARHGISFRHNSRKFQVRYFQDFRFFFAMDNGNLRALQTLRSYAEGDGTQAELALFGRWGQGFEEFQDPYSKEILAFKDIFDQLERITTEFLRVATKTSVPDPV